MDPNRSSPYQTLPISPNIAYLDAGMADLDANFGEGTSSSSSNQYNSAHSLDHGLSSDLAISPLEDYDLTSQETAMLLLGPHGADLTASRLIPDLSLSEGSHYPPLPGYDLAASVLPDIYSTTNYPSSATALSSTLHQPHNTMDSSLMAPGTLSSHPSLMDLSAASGLEPSTINKGTTLPEPLLKEKRRRNNAASARFRMKKTEREHKLERTTKVMGEKLSALEQEASKLEVENKWLRELITTKANEEEEDDGENGKD